MDLQLPIKNVFDNVMMDLLKKGLQRFNRKSLKVLLKTNNFRRG